MTSASRSSSIASATSYRSSGSRSRRMPAASAARSPSNWASTCWAPRIGVAGELGRIHAADVRPADHLDRGPPDDPAGPLPDRQPGHHPVPAPGPLDRHVDHDRGTGGGGQLHLDAEQLPDQPQLEGALLEPAQADRPGGQRDGVGFQAADPQHRHEDRPPGGQFDHQPEHPGRFSIQPQGDHDVPDLADRFAARAEHRQPGELRDEDSGVWRHEDQVRAPTGPADAQPRGPDIPVVACHTARPRRHTQ